MSVYKRAGQAVYAYDFRVRGVRFSGSTGCTSRREAERYEETARTAAQAQVIDRTKPMTFAVASSLYWDEVGQHHRNHVDTERSLAWLQKQIGKSTKISAISAATIASAVAKRRGEGVSAATVNRSVCEPLRAILKRCGGVWGQKVQPISWKDHFLKEPQERIREANIDEEAKLLATIRADYRPALRFAFMSGCRLNEIVTLEWSRVDFFNRQYTVIGKGDKARSIPMTDAVYELLWGEKDNHPTSVFTYKAVKTRDGKQRGKRYPLTENGLKTQWRRVKRDAGVTNFRFHDTRHTAATRLLRASGNLKYVQKLLGHAHLATTSRYAHVTTDDLRAGLEAAHSSVGKGAAVGPDARFDAKSATKSPPTLKKS
ncbi:MAG: site-specific integrase [Nitratireductor sp.]